MGEVIQGQLKKVENTRIAVVVSRFNESVTEKLEKGALETLKEIGYKEDELLVVRVPGAVEIPLVTKTLLSNSQCDGVVALGVVIKGETTHYDYVCQSVERGLSELMLEYMVPIAFGVLTTENQEQALNRAGGSKGHKGVDAAEVVVEMLNTIKKIKNRK